MIVGPSPSEKTQGTKAEAGDVGSIVDAGRQSHGVLQPGEARATFETPSMCIREIPDDDLMIFGPKGSRLCLKTRSGFERLIFRLAASGSIDDKTNIACFAVFVRRENARSRADDGVFRQSLGQKDAK